MLSSKFFVSWMLKEFSFVSFIGICHWTNEYRLFSLMIRRLLSCCLSIWGSHFNLSLFHYGRKLPISNFIAPLFQSSFSSTATSGERGSNEKDIIIFSTSRFIMNALSRFRPIFTFHVSTAMVHNDSLWNIRFISHDLRHDPRWSHHSRTTTHCWT